MTKGKLLVLLGAGWMLLSATTPGAVGSCGTDERDRPADFESYCREREELICTRRFLREEITAEVRDICRWDAVEACQRRAFTGTCQPTRRETEACLRALSSFDTLDTPDDEIEECQREALCNAAPSNAAGSGGSAGSGGTRSAAAGSGGSRPAAAGSGGRAGAAGGDEEDAP